jgi:hypothetical protein
MAHARSKLMRVVRADTEHSTYRSQLAASNACSGNQVGGNVLLVAVVASRAAHSC